MPDVSFKTLRMKPFEKNQQDKKKTFCIIRIPPSLMFEEQMIKHTTNPKTHSSKAV